PLGPHPAEQAGRDADRLGEPDAPPPLDEVEQVARPEVAGPATARPQVLAEDGEGRVGVVMEGAQAAEPAVGLALQLDASLHHDPLQGELRLYLVLVEGRPVE